MHHTDADKLTPATAEAIDASVPGTEGASSAEFLPDVNVPSDVVHEQGSVTGPLGS
jgi:hypothetical protein